MDNDHIEATVHQYLACVISSASEVRKNLAPGDPKLTQDFLDILRNATNKLMYLETQVRK